MCARLCNPSSMFPRPDQTVFDRTVNSLQQHVSDSPAKVEKARKAGKYLQLLLHSQECRSGTDCPNSALCKSVKLLMNHCEKCQNKESCPIAGCLQTKTLLEHLTICRWERKNARLYGTPPKECLICYFMENGDASKPPSPIDTDGFQVPQAPRRFRSGSEEYAERMGRSRHHSGRRSQSVTDVSSFSIIEEEESEECSGRFRSASTSNIIPSFGQSRNSSSDDSQYTPDPSTFGEEDHDHDHNHYDCGHCSRERSSSMPTTRVPFGSHHGGNQAGTPPRQLVIEGNNLTSLRGRSASASLASSGSMLE